MLRTQPDCAAPRPEMVGAGIEVLSEGTILLADGYGPHDDGEFRRGEKDTIRSFAEKSLTEMHRYCTSSDSGMQCTNPALRSSKV